MDAGGKNLISICFSKIAGTPQFMGSKEESMACALRRYGVTDSGIIENPRSEGFLLSDHLPIMPPS
ncbi:MAG: hypothetical protein P8X74_19040 [Reinekea sp.]